MNLLDDYNCQLCDISASYVKEPSTSHHPHIYHRLIIHISIINISSSIHPFIIVSSSTQMSSYHHPPSIYRRLIIDLSSSSHQSSTIVSSIYLSYHITPSMTTLTTNHTYHYLPTTTTTTTTSPPPPPPFPTTTHLEERTMHEVKPPRTGIDMPKQKEDTRGEGKPVRHRISL